MLEEAWHWLRIASPPAATRLGYRREAAALRTRHRRCAVAWQPHLDATRDALLESARRDWRADAPMGSSAHARLDASSPPHRVGVVLGGGLIRDVPWRELLEIFDELVLADLCFDNEARRAARRSAGRVRLMTLDLTGTLDSIIANPARVPSIPMSDQTALMDLIERARWVASVNVLTQLPLLPCAWLCKQGHPEPALRELASAMLRQHLHCLQRCPASVCLVAEVADHLHGPDGMLLESVSRLSLLGQCLEMDTWDALAHWSWLVNPPGELTEGHCERRDVTALHRPYRSNPLPAYPTDECLRIDPPTIL